MAKRLSFSIRGGWTRSGDPLAERSRPSPFLFLDQELALVEARRVVGHELGWPCHDRGLTFMEPFSDGTT
jgi:hypothetical protein